ncbi:MAG: mannonate dehydratase [Roseinatronobacter sp.]
MHYTWRWFGPEDPVSLADARQAGATGIVSALHHVPNGTVWPLEDIAARKSLIEAAGLRWSVVESIPVPEAIKLGSDGWEDLADAWAQSALNLAQHGITTICYNFMPILDWTRTRLRHRLADGAECLRFDLVDLAAFDLHILQRPNARLAYGQALLARAESRARSLDEAQRTELIDTILAGLPGSEESYSLEGFRDQIARYDGLGADGLRRNLAQFLARVIPQIAPHGVKLALHPDDPPRPIFGLPRVVSTAQDLRAILAMQDDPANGLTFCVGSLGVRADNDLPAMLQEFGAHVQFLHLRNTRRDALPADDMAQTDEIAGESFEEAAHLDGDADMVRLISIVVELEQTSGRTLPFRPDHGHALLSDLRQGYRPGYPAIGRLRGMAEIRGIEHALVARSTR